MKQTPKLTFALLIGVVIGALAYRTWDAHTAIVRHWRTVHEYREFIFNTENYHPDPNTGFSVATPPKDLEPSLAALVAAGELRYLDIVLPTVPYSNRDATRHWMAFCERHNEDIVWAYGNPISVAFPTKGEQPLHLQLWFPEESIPVIQQLISELESLETKE